MLEQKSETGKITILTVWSFHDFGETGSSPLYLLAIQGFLHNTSFSDDLIIDLFLFKRRVSECSYLLIFSECRPGKNLEI